MGPINLFRDLPVSVSNCEIPPNRQHAYTPPSLSASRSQDELGDLFLVLAALRHCWFIHARPRAHNAEVMPGRKQTDSADNEISHLITALLT